MNNQVNEVLEKIREVCDLKRLEEDEETASFLVGIGYPVKVTSCTSPKVYDYNWSVNKAGYAYRMSGGKCIFMHRAVLDFDLPDGWCIDHINGDPLDNRLSNLRAVKQQQNTMNRDASGGRSKYKGVYLKVDKERPKPWVASIKIDQKNQIIGYFDNEVEAAEAYDKRARFFFGEYARLNFPEALPVQLNHFTRTIGNAELPHPLCVLEMRQSGNGLYMRLSAEIGKEENEYVRYETTKSVEDNLRSNPELTKWVHGVIIGKE